MTLAMDSCKLCLRVDAMVQSASMSKTWASSDAAVEEAPQALTYKVEVYTGDVRGAGTHVRIGNMHSEIVHRHLCACFSVHTCTSMLELVDLIRPNDAENVQRCSCRAMIMESCFHFCRDRQAPVMLQAPAAVQLIGTEGESDEFIIGKRDNHILKH